MHDGKHVERQALLLAVAHVDDDARGLRVGEHLEAVAEEFGEVAGGQRGVLCRERLERRCLAGHGVRRVPVERGRDGAEVQAALGEAEHEEEGAIK